MRKILLILAVMLGAGCINVKASQVSDKQHVLPASVSHRSSSEIADILVKIFAEKNLDPQVANKLVDATLKQNELMMGGQPKKGPARDAYDDLEALIKMYLRMLGVSDEDYDYFMSTVLPLYYYSVDGRNVPADTEMDMQLDTVAAAPIDGCYFTIGSPLNQYNPAGIDCELCQGLEVPSDLSDPTSPLVQGKPKTNGAYPWGLVRVGKKIFWGTVNNILCMPSWQSMTSLGANKPYENKCWVCEYDKGLRKDAGQNGDIVRPRVYMYDTESGVTTDITPEGAYVLDDCLGLRSAAAHNGVVFIGGPGLDSDAGQQSTSSAFLAFDEDGKLLATSDMSNVDGCRVTDVRRWLLHEGVLYVGVAIVDQNGKNKGAVLRWYGDKTNPFKFHIVGYTANEAGEICFHNGRIYAGGWPTDNFPKSAVFEGPEVPEGGLTPDDATEWEVKWCIDQYEPNPMVQRYNQCSLLRSYKGKLYWSMWFPQYALPLMVVNLKQDISSVKGMATLLALMRQATLWRTEDFSDVEMLYGESDLPNVNMLTGEVIQPMPNNSGYTPVYGRAGFDRLFTSYMWASAEYNGDLYIGTMSSEGVVEPGLEILSDGSGSSAGASFLFQLLGLKEENTGYELYRFRDNESPAETVTQDGFGNHAQYGIRNMVISEDGSDLYIGTASPFNINEYGGWRILKFHDNDYVAPPTGIKQSTFKPAAILVKNENGYVTFSSLLGEKITSMQVTDVAGRQVYSEEPANRAAYLFQSQVGSGMYIVTVTTKSGSWTTKVVMK